VYLMVSARTRPGRETVLTRTAAPAEASSEPGEASSAGEDPIR